MNSNYVQNLRYKLQKRFRKVNAAGLDTFYYSLHRFWAFLRRSDLFSPLLDQLSVLVPAAEADSKRIMGGEKLHGENDNEEAALAYWVIRTCLESQDRQLPINVGIAYTRSNFNESLEFFKDMFVEPLYEYLDEQLDDRRAVLAMLGRYKRKCEWFCRSQLQAICAEEAERSEEGTQHGRTEKRLALHLYEYLFDQGLSFSIEPTSVSGEADLVAAQQSEDPLIADVKIFDPAKNKNKKYIITGFHQVYQYTLDYHEPFGYLVIFNTCDRDLAISTSRQEQSIPFIVHNGKTIFIIVIDIFNHEKPASKRGKLNSYVITENEFVTEHVDSEEPSEEAATSSV